jgi:hypothetical protein
VRKLKEKLNKNDKKSEKIMEKYRKIRKNREK